MNVKPWICLPLMLLAAAPAAFADDRVDRLPEEYRKWLQEEVVYIITDVEKKVFLLLTTREERERFIEAFWARRDPDPGTLVNEFKDEHYRRIEYANRVLGREAPRPGWKTDRGMYYIILGEPLEIQRYDGYNQVVPIEIWFYMGDTSLGLPPRFNLTFFQENDIGEYRLYNPLGDGPERLIRAGSATQLYQVNQHQAVDLLEIVSMDLARASLTVDLTEPTSQFLSGRNTIDPIQLTLRPNLSVDRTLANIIESPLRKVDSDYLKGYLDGNRVSVDYSFRYFGNRSTVAVLYGPDKTPYIHYSIEIEPDDFTLVSDERDLRYYTTLEVNLEVRDKEGRLVASEVNQPLLQLSASEFERAKAFPFAYRDSFPVIPGDYQVSLVLKNRASKEYTAGEWEISIPPIAEDEPALSEPVLAYNKEISSDRAGNHLTFQIGNTHVYPSVDGVFTIGSNVTLLAQAFGAGPDYGVQITILDGEETLEKWDTKLGDYVNGPILQTLSLLGMESGRFQVRVDLLHPSGTLVARRSAPLQVSPRSSIPRPGFVYRHSFNSDVPGLVDMTLGNQLMATGRVAEAEVRLEKAVAFENPNLPMARWRLASIVLFSRKADRALELLLPLKDDFPNEYEVVEGIGFAYYIKKAYSQAKEYLERSTALRAPDTSLLNALGDCYEHLGETTKAKDFYERSLELNPSQEGVKARLAGITGGN